MRRFTSLALISIVVIHGPVRGQEKKSPPPAPTQGKEAALKEQLSRTEHSVRVNGAELRYTATAGNLLLKEEDGKTSLTATRTFVQAGKRIEGRAEILKGLKDGDRVVALRACGGALLGR